MTKENIIKAIKDYECHALPASKNVFLVTTLLQNSSRNIATAMALTAKENNRYSLSMTLS